MDYDWPSTYRVISVSNVVVLEEAGGQAQSTMTLSQPVDEASKFSFQTIGVAAQAGPDVVGRAAR